MSLLLSLKASTLIEQSTDFINRARRRALIVIVDVDVNSRISAKQHGEHLVQLGQLVVFGGDDLAPIPLCRFFNAAAIRAVQSDDRPILYRLAEMTKDAEYGRHTTSPDQRDDKTLKQ